jgi:hypothetical protein
LLVAGLADQCDGAIREQRKELIVVDDLNFV